MKLSVIFLVLISLAQVPFFAQVHAEESADTKDEDKQMRILLYQTRKSVPEGDRIKTTATGSQLFSQRCGYCHLALGMGTNIIAMQRVKLGESPEMGLLENRTDLIPSYVTAVVRHGKMAMPKLTQVDVTDSELEAISHYLSKGNK